MKVEIIKPHIHDGKEYKPGDILTLDSEIAEWLVGKKIVKKLEEDQHKKGGKKWGLKVTQ